jgi:hypothetical protein
VQAHRDRMQAAANNAAAAAMIQQGAGSGNGPVLDPNALAANYGRAPAGAPGLPPNSAVPSPSPTGG